MRKLTVLLLLLFAFSVAALADDNTDPRVGQVGPGRFGDGDSKKLRLDNSGAAVTVLAHGKYFETTQRGLAFIYSTAQAGVLLAAPTTTFFGPMLWNPCGSGRDLEITKVVVGDVSGATVRGHIAYAILLNAGSQAATGSAILTATKVTPQNAYIGSGVQSGMIWSPAVGTYTAAPTYLAPMFGVAGTAPSSTPVDDVDGRIVIAPCSAFFVGANAGITLTATVAIYGIEQPIHQRAIP